jgi:preprotein translocase subunit SecG
MKRTVIAAVVVVELLLIALLLWDRSRAAVNSSSSDGNQTHTYVAGQYNVTSTGLIRVTWLGEYGLLLLPIPILIGGFVLWIAPDVQRLRTRPAPAQVTSDGHDSVALRGHDLASSTEKKALHDSRTVAAAGDLETLDIGGHPVIVDLRSVEDVFVIGEERAILPMVTGKSQKEMRAVALQLAATLWREPVVRKWCEVHNKLVSLAAVPQLSATAALDCVKDNFDTSNYDSFLVSEGEVTRAGHVALVLALNRSAV